MLKYNTRGETEHEKGGGDGGQRGKKAQTHTTSGANGLALKAPPTALGEEWSALERAL